MGDTEAGQKLGRRLNGGRLKFERGIRYSSLPAPARHLALTLATWADIETGVIPDRFQPARETLEQATGLSRGAVFKHLNTLDDEGWISRETGGGRNRRTRYTLRIPPGAKTGHEVTPFDAGNRSRDDPFPGNGSRGDQQTGHDVNENGSPGDPKSPFSSSESLSRERDTKAQRVIRRTGLLDQADEEAFIAWASRKFNIQHAGWWTSCADDVPGHITTWLQMREKSAPAKPAGVMCSCCSTIAPVALTYRAKPYCATCTATCASCQQQHPEDQLNNGECHPCRTARSPAA